MFLSPLSRQNLKFIPVAPEKGRKEGREERTGEGLKMIVSSIDRSQAPIFPFLEMLMRPDGNSDPINEDSETNLSPF